MFGGADPVIPNLVPSNITIRRNLMTKPSLGERRSSPLKNLLELKNAQNVLIEGNIFENNWHAGRQGTQSSSRRGIRMGQRRGRWSGTSPFRTT